MSTEKKPKWTRLRVWMTVNLVLLLTFTGWVYRAADSRGATTSQTTASQSVLGAARSTAPTVAQIESEPGRYFGVTADDVPWSAPAYTAVANAAGYAPNMVEYYSNWTEDFSSTDVFDAYAEGALPVITWEPFAHGTSGKTQVNQPGYALSTIVAGRHDAYITRFAEAVKAAGVPVAIRFMHEMNGDWYPWAVNLNGNTASEYVLAWRHVWDIFHQVGATNVIWIWAPNVLRGAQRDFSLAEVYPGDQYVNWVGMSAYEDYESTEEALIGPTLDEIRRFTKLPLLITETGGTPNPDKVPWMENFLAWLPEQPDVIGFIWNENSRGTGARKDWGYNATAASLQAFRSGMAEIRLATIPAA